VVELAENVGFGRASNRALAEVREPVTLLLNPDVELLDGSLLTLAGEAVRRGLPERLLAPLVLAPDGTREDSVHPLPGSPADLLHAIVPPAAVPGAVGVPIAPWRARRPRRVGWAVGCAIAARTDTLRRLGPFDEQIFLYGEDLDLGLRAAAEGVETWFWPSARILHHRAHSARVAFGGEPFELLARARRDVIARLLGDPRARLDDAAQAVTFASRGALKRLAGRSAARERRQLAALATVRSEARSVGRRERAAPLC
jgi:GT2 family glycosyltransferase